MGILKNEYLLDDDDIKCQVKMLYSASIILRSRFIKCSNTIKHTLFRSNCSPYMVVIYSTTKRSILLITCMLATMMLKQFCITWPRFTSTNEGPVASEIPTFLALICRNIYGFVQRCLKSPNNWIVSYEFEQFLFVQVACTNVPLVFVYFCSFCFFLHLWTLGQ